MAEQTIITPSGGIAGSTAPVIPGHADTVLSAPSANSVSSAAAPVSGEGLLSFLDGTALAPAAGLVEAGGPVVLILLGLSIFTLTIILFKLWQYLRLGGGASGAVEQALGLWLSGRRGEAYDLLKARRGAVVHAVAHAMRGLNNPQAGMEAVREDVERVAQGQIKALKSWLKALEAVVQIAPLLGLFGTVIGMIAAFKALQEAGSQADPAVLAGGIWVALLTTAVGLAVAIPVSFILYWFESLVERERRAMEAALTSLFTGRITEQEPDLASPEPIRQPQGLAHAG